MIKLLYNKSIWFDAKKKKLRFWVLTFYMNVIPFLKILWKRLMMIGGNEYLSESQFEYDERA